MKTHLFILILLLGCLWGACSEQQNSSAECWYIDIEKDYPKLDLSLQDLAEVHYIPLETDSIFLVSSGKIVCSTNNNIAFIDNKTGNILVYSLKSGKKDFVINRKGGGPEEYLVIGSVVLDEKNLHVYAWSIMEGVIKVYDKNGNYIQTLPLRNYKKGDYLYLTNMIDFGEYILCSQNRRGGPTIHYLLNKEIPGKTILLDSVPSQKVVDIYLQNKKNNVISSVSPEVTPTTKNENYTILADYSCDTIYSIDNQNLVKKPYIVRTPSTQLLPCNKILNYDGECDDWIFLTSIELTYDFNTKEGLHKKHYGLQKTTKKIYEISLLNSDFINSQYIELSKKNYFFKTYDLKKENQSKLICNEKLNNMVDSLDEEDNGIIMVTKIN